MPLADVYLEFLGGRCRPNTVLAAAYDLKVFFTVVGKPPEQVAAADVLAFITAQRTGGRRRACCSRWRARTAGGCRRGRCARRLSIVSGFFAFLQARGDVAANPVPRGLPTRRERSASGSGRPAGARHPAAAADLVPGRGRCADRGAAHAPGPGDGRGDGAGRAAPLRGPRAAAGGPARRRSGGCSSPRARAAGSG